MNQPEPTTPFFLELSNMKACIEFIGTVQNIGFWLVQILLESTQTSDTLTRSRGLAGWAGLGVPFRVLGGFTRILLNYTRHYFEGFLYVLYRLHITNLQNHGFWLARVALHHAQFLSFLIDNWR